MSKTPSFDFAIIRHGQSEANKENIFTGWRDSPLSAQGISEARAAGRLLKTEGFTFDIAYTSLQSRAIKTLWLVLEEMDLMWIPVRKHWQLNERHYGRCRARTRSRLSRHLARRRSTSGVGAMPHSRRSSN